MKTQELINNLQKALVKLQEAKTFEPIEALKKSAIQRFEYTFELSWKLMNSILKDQGITVYGVKNIIRSASQLGLIDNVSRWFDFAQAHNLTSHIYHEEIADDVYKVAVGDFSNFVAQLLTQAQKQLNTNN